MVKHSQRLLPFFGWLWYLTDTIFLHRDWKRDRTILEQGAKRIASYPDTVPVPFVIFPEGTRLSPSKLAASNELLLTRGQPVFKHLLFPRHRGFFMFLRGLKLALLKSSSTIQYQTTDEQSEFLRTLGDKEATSTLIAHPQNLMGDSMSGQSVIDSTSERRSETAKN
ncbi:unnamed protein product, partial [Protopolystoma xenopodis]